MIWRNRGRVKNVWETVSEEFMLQGGIIMKEEEMEANGEMKRYRKR